MPLLEWLPGYPVSRALLPDIAGGATLGCILMGQSLAHASLCKVNLINGAYSCMLPPLAYAMFGTCVHGSVGTGGLVSLLTGEQLANYGPDIDERTRVGSILTLLVGVILALMGICQLAFLARFLSRPALSGFITASALLIICSQLSPMLGLPAWAAQGGIVQIVEHHISNLEWTSRPTLTLSVLALAFLMQAKRLKKVKVLHVLSDFKELILLGSAALFCCQFNASVTSEDAKISVVGAMPAGLPSIAFPLRREDSALVRELLPSAALVALVVFISSFAGAKKFAMKDGYQVKAFNELLALGFANCLGAMSGAVPTQVGLSRMAIARECGVQTQLGSNVIVSLVVACIVRLFSSYLYDVPRCVLSAIIVNGASHLTEFDQVPHLWEFARNKRYNWKARLDIAVWFVGFFCTLYLGAFAGMLTAVATSLMLILYQVVNPEITTLGYLQDGGDVNVPRKWVAEGRAGALQEMGILVFRLEGPIFYANAETLQEWLEEQEFLREEQGLEPVKGIIFSAQAVPFMDTTAIQALEEMVKAYNQRKILFFIANTFGQSGRLIEDRLESIASNPLPAALKPKMEKAATIDDFVQVIKDYSTHDSFRVPLGKSWAFSRKKSANQLRMSRTLNYT